MLARRPTPKLNDHHLSAACDCLFNIFAAALHIGDRLLYPEDAPCRGDKDPLIRHSTDSNPPYVISCLTRLTIILCILFSYILYFGVSVLDVTQSDFLMGTGVS